MKEWTSVRDGLPEIPVGQFSRVWVVLESNRTIYENGKRAGISELVNRRVELFEWYNLTMTRDEIDHVVETGSAPESAEWLNNYINDDGDLWASHGFCHEYNEEGYCRVDSYPVIDGVPTHLHGDIRAERIVYWQLCEAPDPVYLPVDVKSAIAAAKAFRDGEK